MRIAVAFRSFGDYIILQGGEPVAFYIFIWDGKNQRHVAEHGVTQDEFAEVVCNADRVEKSRSSGRTVAFGYTSTDKYLACVFEMLDDDTVYPVTAYEVED